MGLGIYPQTIYVNYDGHIQKYEFVAIKSKEMELINLDC